MSNAAILCVALLLDAALGEPRWLWGWLPHPAVLMGRAVAALDRWLNRGKDRDIRGVVALGILVWGAMILGFLVHALPLHQLWVTLLAAILIAQRSLVDHVADVATALGQSLEAGRASVAKIVGRDTAAMTEPEIARAAIESAAENLSDAVVAPAFWFLVAGLPGLLVYKAVNTADSMIGHRTPEYEKFGWASARVDDLLNWIPARLTALILAALGKCLGQWGAITADARRHRSPNAGWPEAAAARVLGVAVSGPRSYQGQRVEYPFVNDAGRKEIGAAEITASTRLLWRAWAVVLGLSAILAVLALLR